MEDEAAYRLQADAQDKMNKFHRVVHDAMEKNPEADFAKETRKLKDSTPEGRA